MKGQGTTTLTRSCGEKESVGEDVAIVSYRVRLREREDERNEREGRSVCELWQVFDNVEAPPKLRVFACCEGERDVEFIVHGVSSSILLPPSIAFKVNNVIVLLNRIVEVAYADSSSKYNCYTFVSL